MYYNIPPECLYKYQPGMSDDHRCLRIFYIEQNRQYHKHFNHKTKDFTALGPLRTRLDTYDVFSSAILSNKCFVGGCVVCFTYNFK